MPTETQQQEVTLKEANANGFMSQLDKGAKQQLRNLGIASNIISEGLEVVDSKICKKAAIEIVEDRIQLRKWKATFEDEEDKIIVDEVLQEQKQRRIV